MEKNAMNSLLSLLRKTDGYRQAMQFHTNQENFSSNVILANFKVESDLDRVISLAAKALAASDYEKAVFKCDMKHPDL